MMLFLEPPPQYDHPYHGQVIEQRLSFLANHQTLSRPHQRLLVGHERGLLHRAAAGREDERLIALMRQHEIGHCNGWPSYHRPAGG